MLGIVVGLAAEARLAHGLGGRVAIGGGEAAGAATAARQLVASGVTALLSFGLAGGLSQTLAAGNLVVPMAVVSESGESWPTDSALSARVGVQGGTLLAAATVLKTREEKRRAWEATGADAVDLESGAVARIAAEFGLRFAVLRAVCDPAHRTLPHAATVALDAGGRIQPRALLNSIVRNPLQLPDLIRLGREAALARRALRARVSVIGSLD